MATRELYLDKSCALWRDKTPSVIDGVLTVKLSEMPYKGKYFAVRKLKRGTETLPIENGAFSFTPTVGTLELVIVLFVDGKKQAEWAVEPLEVVEASTGTAFSAHPVVTKLSARIDELSSAVDELSAGNDTAHNQLLDTIDSVDMRLITDENENARTVNDLRVEINQLRKIARGLLAVVYRIYADPFGANTKNLDVSSFLKAIGADLHPDNVAEIEEFVKGDKV